MSRKPPKRPGVHHADADWVKQLKKKLPRGQVTRLAERIGVDKGTVSKLSTTGQGSAGLIMQVSLDVGIAPPKNLVGEAQHRLLDGLYRLMEAAQQRFKGEPRKVAAAVELAIAAFEEAVTAHGDGPMLPLGQPRDVA